MSTLNYVMRKYWLNLDDKDSNKVIFSNKHFSNI